MSETLQISVVCEGITDHHVIQAAIESILSSKSAVVTMIQPEKSIALDGLGAFGGGWKGVRNWCNTALPFIGIRDVPDALILHVDADVADDEEINCSRSCPPARATTDSLREFVITNWCGGSIPAQTVFCTPSKNIESWVLQALYPNDAIVKAGIECRAKPESLLAAKPKDEKMVSRKGDSYKKHPNKYLMRQPEISKNWPSVRKGCTEADRFSREFLKQIK